MLRIVQPGQVEQTINKSRFVAYVEYCSGEQEVAQLLRRIISEHPHASHLAYAYRVRNQEGQGFVTRCHDAGEPAGTAGKPILQHLEGRDLANACIAVVRYYGGVNLGTGGLVRAYGGTARMALDSAQLGPYVEMTRLRLSLAYKQLDMLNRDLARIGGQLLDKQFGEAVTVVVTVPIGEAGALQERYN